MKDPAALLYIDVANELQPIWMQIVDKLVFKPFLHQYDKKELPNDLERLAVLANVNFGV